MKKILTIEEKKILRKIGDTLLKAREDAEFPLSKVSDITKISVSCLQALEDGDYSMFDNITFPRGFLKNYAQVLKIEYSWMINKINAIFQQNNDSLELSYYQEEHGWLSIEKMTSSFGLFCIIGIIALILSGGLLYVTLNFGLSTSFIGKIATEEKVSPIIKNTDLELQLLGKKQGWIRLVIDESQALEMYIDNEKEYTWTAKQNFRLLLGKGDLVDIYLNQQKFVVNGEYNNKLIEISLDRSVLE